jgi:hypothetical protein
VGVGDLGSEQSMGRDSRGRSGLCSKGEQRVSGESQAGRPRKGWMAEKLMGMPANGTKYSQIENVSIVWSAMGPGIRGGGLDPERGRGLLADGSRGRGCLDGLSGHPWRGVVATVRLIHGCIGSLNRASGGARIRCSPIPGPSVAMRDNQYAIFRDLDRRCVSRGLEIGECEEAVRAKRSLIENDLNHGNPLVRDVLAGRTTFVAEYDFFSRRLRGIRRFVPQPHDAGHNERLRHLSVILPNVAHFLRRSAFAVDNPVNGLLYGLFASLAVDLVVLHAQRDEGEGNGGLPLYLGLVFGFAGFVAGAAAMMKYRTRDPKVIHAREAAAYMDLNYAFFATGDDHAWAEFIRMQGGAARVVLARPDEEG